MIEPTATAAETGGAFLRSLARDARLLAGSNRVAVADSGKRLAAAVTRDDWPAEQTAPLATILIDAITQAGEPGQARIALLLGILAEKQPSALPVVAEGMGTYLRLLAGAAAATPRYLALLFLLAHFPQEKEQIMGAAGKHAGTDPNGTSRLARLLTQPDSSDPETANWAGRSWPSPALLAIRPEEIAATAKARAALPLSQVIASWDADTQALLAYAGGLAVSAGA